MRRTARRGSDSSVVAPSAPLRDVAGGPARFRQPSSRSLPPPMTAHLLLAALGHPAPAAGLADAVAQARTVGWLEDTKIRALPLEARCALRDASAEAAWAAAFAEVRRRGSAGRGAVRRSARADACRPACGGPWQYLAQLGCPVPAARRGEALTWLLGHAVGLEYHDAGAARRARARTAQRLRCGCGCAAAALGRAAAARAARCLTCSSAARARADAQRSGCAPPCAPRSRVVRAGGCRRRRRTRRRRRRAC
jgi:hypothetical protein